MRILLATEYYGQRGGGEAWIRIIHKELAKTHEVDVIGFDEGCSIRLERTRFGRFADALKLARVITRRPGYDVVHYAGYLPLLASIFVRTRATSIGSVHLFLGNKWTESGESGSAIKRLSENLILRLASCETLTVPSTFTQRAVHEEIGRRTVVLANPFDIADVRVEHHNADENMIRLCYVGSITPLKRVPESCRALMNRSDEFSFLIAGDGSDMNRVREIARSDHRIELLGRIEHAEALERIANCDIIVQPSVSETFSYLVLEGLSLGARVVSTRVGVAAELDHPNLTLIEDPSELEHLDLKALKRRTSNTTKYLERFRIDAIINELETIYNAARERRHERIQPRGSR